ncbi:MAG: right-handed parallel beta-helix repeat-containing protein, partial [Dehalococcoidia bacterium]
MKWLSSRTAVVALVAAVAVATIALGAWQGWLAQAAPDTVYVNDNLLPDIEGCNAPDASTIAAGIAAADPGDTVVICEGTYAGNVTVGKSVTIEGRAEANRDDIIVQGGAGVDGFAVTADNVTVRHIKFDGIDHTGNGIHVSGDNATIQDVEAVKWGIGIFLEGSSGSVVEDSDVDDNAGAGIAAAGGENSVIQRNVAGANNFRGVIVENEVLTLVAENDLSGSDAALLLDADAPDVLKVQVLRNTINAGSDGIFIDVIDSADSLIIIGGRAADANSFAGSPDHTTDN